MASTVNFPKSRPDSVATDDPSRLSIVSAHATAVEICYAVYGEPPESADALDRYYESSASEVCPFNYECSTRFDGANFRYENPFLTATSRSVISDLQKLSRHFNEVDIPRPLAMICTLFRLEPPNSGYSSPLFRALRVWTDIGDISESESFDGHRRTMIEHTLNVLFLPGIHNDGSGAAHGQVPSDSLVSSSSSIHHGHGHLSSPSMPVPGTSLSVPSPFHFQLPIITRLSFNEQGRITHHRDFWDLKDVMGLVPGVSLAQWIGTRLAARSLTYASKLFLGGTSSQSPTLKPKPDLENGLSSAEKYSASARAELGMK